MAELSLRKRLLKRKKQLAEKGQGYKYIIFKEEGTKRMRILPCGEEKDWGQEVTFFYLGSTLRGYISPASFGEKCAVMDLYNKLSASKDEEDNDLAKTFKPKKRFLVPHIVYKDLKGKKVDTEIGAKLALLTTDLYNSVLDLYLDEEQGDFTDPKTGFDLKYTRTGKGQFDTEYSAIPCRPTPLPKEYNKTYDLEAMVRAIMPTYEETRDIRKKFLSGSDEGDETPKKKKSSKDKVLKKKKKKSDI